jgi:hypothetical protein
MRDMLPMVGEPKLVLMVVLVGAIQLIAHLGGRRIGPVL